MTIATLTSQDVLAIVNRRKWLILSIIVAALGLAWGLCQVLPKSYRSSTLILVETQGIPESYVSAVVGGSVGERITKIHQYVLSRTVLGQIIDQFQLSKDPTQDRELLIEGLRKNVKIETKGALRDRVEGFSLSFAHEDPAIAMKVTGRLAAQFVEENLRSREQLVEGTTDFLAHELANAKVSLESQEREIAQFKRKFMGELPGQVEANLQTLNRLQKDLSAATQSLQNRTDRRTAVAKMINAYETMGLSIVEAPRDPLGGAGGATTTSPAAIVRSAPSASTGGRPGDPLVQRLKELERLRATLSAEYKSTYPDLIKVSQEITQVKAQLAERSVMPQEKEDEGTQGKATVRPEKVAHQTIMDPYLHELKKEMNENEIGIGALKEQEQKLKAQIREYEIRVEKAPEREQEMIVLQRDYENTKRNYQALLEKQLNAKISENLEKRQKGEKFKILDPAYLPSRPESPDQLKIMLVGLLLGCGLGFGTAIGLEIISGVIRRPEEAENLLGLPVLASIPDFILAYEASASKLLGVRYGSADERVSSPGIGKPSLPGRVENGEEQPKGTLLGWKKSPASNSKTPARGTRSESLKLELNLVAKWRPDSLVAEQFRVAATRLVLAGSSQKSSIVIVSSAVQGEGKSATASNLAYVLAQDLGKQTLLIDCDFKRPVIHSYTGVPGKPGLAEMIYGDAPLDACLHRCGESSLWVLPSGRRDHRLVDLAKIPQIGLILDDLRQRFEFIIMDAPPILPLADVNLLSSMADMLLLVVRAARTPQAVVQTAIKTLKPASRAGIILTGYNSGKAPPYLQEYYAAGRGGVYQR